MRYYCLLVNPSFAQATPADPKGTNPGGAGIGWSGNSPGAWRQPMKSWLILPTLIYFVSGTIFLREFHKGAKSPAA